MLRLRLFGGAAIERDGVPVTETADLHKALALLALLAASRERGMSRDQLAAFLWPESDSERARAALSQTLYTLRKHLAEPDVFVGTRTLRLNPTAIGSDLGDFERALECGDLEAAVRLSSDAFLDGFFIPNCLELERWIDAERADLVQRWAAAIESLARRATELGDHASAIRWWRGLTAAEPGNSRAAAALVEALAAVGDRAGALQAARSHEEFLRSEFDAPPDPAVSALAERIRRGGGNVLMANSRDTPSRSDAEPSAPRQPDGRSVGHPAVTASPRVAGVATVLAFIVMITIWGVTATRGATMSDSRGSAGSHSVAVLYFDNLSPDSADAYLADGLTEEIFSRLGKVPSLQVKRTSRDAVNRWRDSLPNYLPALGRALGVRTLVLGSVRKGRDRVRVSVQLVNASTGFRIWGDDYERAPGDLLAIETGIASSVATGIVGHLSPNDSILLRAKSTMNAEAYDHLLRGNFNLALRTLPAVTLAIVGYQEAVRLDPLFTQAHARMAFAYGICSQNGLACFGLGRDSLIARGSAAADAALRMDSTSSDAWLALAALRAEKDPRNLEGAPEAIDRAVALDPASAEGHHIKAFLYRVWSDSIALAAYNTALEIDPIRPMTLFQLSYTNVILRRYDAALKSIDSAISVAAQSDPYLFLARADVRRLLGDTAGARRDAEIVLRGDSTPRYLSRARIQLARLQVRDSGGARSRQLVETAIHDLSGARTTGKLERGVALTLAVGLLAVGENERAIAFLERVEPSAAFWYSLRLPELDAIRGEPRFQALYRRTQPRRPWAGRG